jgi:hypothetical protein
MCSIQQGNTARGCVVENMVDLGDHPNIGLVNRKILYVFTYINIKNMPDNLFFMDGSVVSTEFRTGQLLTDGDTGGNGEGTRKGEGRQ